MRRQLTAAGAKVESLTYGPAADLAERLARTDIYIWLPAGDDANTPADQRKLLAQWLDAGKGRQIHFHWNGGTRDADGLTVPHSARLRPRLRRRARHRLRRAVAAAGPGHPVCCVRAKCA